jgi:hypothetical protein
MWGVAAHLTAPITQLTEIIRQNIKKVKKESGTQIDSKQKAIQLQVYFSGGYEDRNKEMNELYLSYSQLAKILAVGHDSS